MTTAHVARVASNMIELIKEWDLDSIKGAVGTIFPDTVDDMHHGEEYIEVALHPASADAYVISYIRRIGQTPLTIIVNTAQSYIKIMLTAEKTLEGFTAFDEEESFGIMQDKKLNGIDFAALVAELTALSKLS